MIRNLSRIILLLEQIVQTPVEMFVRPGQEITISCSHSIQSYDQIFWYKQSAGHEMQLLGYMYGTGAFPEKDQNVTIEGDANRNKNCTLTINRVGLESRAVYFCAARLHSAAHRCLSVHKPPRIAVQLYYLL
uniref:Ig-like domain-containing protein n=1 Tax=Fundulus heteroclitus TaxID=8078 RepID=A0A3Q2P982_FUNHE